MTTLIIVYIVFLLLIGTYVGINVFHIIRFRLKDKDDKSHLALFIYLGLVTIVLLVSIIGAVIAYNL